MRLIMRWLPEQQVLLARDSIHEPDEQGWTALMYTAHLGSVECMSVLLNHAPEQQVVAVSEDGDTTLEIACDNDHMDCARLLLVHKSPIPSTVMDKLTPVIHDMAASLHVPDMLLYTLIAHALARRA